jgi:hypothetical protein
VAFIAFVRFFSTRNAFSFGASSTGLLCRLSSCLDGLFDCGNNRVRELALSSSVAMFGDDLRVEVSNDADFRPAYWANAFWAGVDGGIHAIRLIASMAFCLSASA